MARWQVQQELVYLTVRNGFEMFGDRIMVPIATPRSGIDFWPAAGEEINEPRFEAFCFLP